MQEKGKEKLELKESKKIFSVLFNFVQTISTTFNLYKPSSW